jgi:hypothetical protein
MLFQNSVEEKLIRERTGHRSNALLKYEKPNLDQQRKVGEILGPPEGIDVNEEPSEDRKETDFVLLSSAAHIFGNNWYLLSDLEKVNIFLHGSTNLDMLDNQRAKKLGCFFWILVRLLIRFGIYTSLNVSAFETPY